MTISFKRCLTWIITGIHALFFLSLFFAPSLSPRREQRMTVKLHQPKISAPKAAVQITSSSDRRQKTAPIAKNTPSHKEVHRKPATSQKKPQQKPTIKPSSSNTISKNREIKAKKSPLAEPKQPAVSEDLIKELEESIAKMDAPQRNGARSAYASKPARKLMHAPTPLTSFDPIPMGEAISSEALKELLVQELRSMLHLPEYGEVKMKLTIRSDGSIREVIVLKTASKKNEEYLQKELPKHAFQFLQDLGSQEKELSFVITFCNDM